MSPTLDHMDAAYRDAVAHGWSRAPIAEMLIPSTIDDTLAPPGRHGASPFRPQCAPVPPDGRSWDVEHEAAADRIVATVTRGASNFAASVIGRQILSPLDLERIFWAGGGDIIHGAMSLDQLWAARPILYTATIARRSRRSTSAARAGIRAAASRARRGTTSRVRSWRTARCWAAVRLGGAVGGRWRRARRASPRPRPRPCPFRPSLPRDGRHAASGPGGAPAVNPIRNGWRWALGCAAPLV